MTQSLATIQPQAYPQAAMVPTKDSLADKMRLAGVLAQADMLPDAYFEKQGNVLLAILYGEAVGVNAAMAIWGVHIIEKRPSPSANMVAGLIRGAGHTLRVRGDSVEAVAEIIRKDDPDFTFSVKWTIDMAKQANLIDRKGSNWGRYPGQMLKRRAIAEVCRDACPEILCGLRTPDEMGYAEDTHGNPVFANGAPVRVEEQPTLTPEPAPATKRGGGKAYNQISTGQDVVVTDGRNTKKVKEEPAQAPQPEPAPAPEPEVAEAELVEDPPAAESEPPPPVEEDPAPALRKEVVARGKQFWGDKSSVRLKEFTAGVSIASATAEQCRTWLARMDTLTQQPADELGGLEV